MGLAVSDASKHFEEYAMSIQLSSQQLLVMQIGDCEGAFYSTTLCRT